MILEDLLEGEGELPPLLDGDGLIPEPQGPYPLCPHLGSVGSGDAFGFPPDLLENPFSPVVLIADVKALLRLPLEAPPLALVVHNTPEPRDPLETLSHPGTLQNNPRASGGFFSPLFLPQM